ncbi:hypothetical protein OPQ81_010573 [Rhizoctonia solani]|nr:hypothetical protein OPQ81_010573 [Rhizoctonia solani]
MAQKSTPASTSNSTINDKQTGSPIQPELSYGSVGFPGTPRNTLRRNISAAPSDNFLKDLGLNTNDYNNGQMNFLFSFTFAEIPSQLVSKRLGPDVWLPIQSVTWSIVAMLQCLLKSRAGFFVTCCLPGPLGGFIPDMILFLSYFYTGRELPIRLSFFWTSYTLTNISGALLGCGIFRMCGIHGWEGWRYLFLIEGVVTAESLFSHSSGCLQVLPKLKAFYEERNDGLRSEKSLLWLIVY